MRVSWLLALAGSAASGVAAAQSPPQTTGGVAAKQQSHESRPPKLLRTSSAWAERPLAFDGTVGLGTPLGTLGLSFDYAPIRWVSLGAGIGTNIDGLQKAGMLRVRFTPNRPTSLFAGGGYSQGPWSQGTANRYGLWSLPRAIYELNSTTPEAPWRHWKRGRWINLELGGETRQNKGDGFDARGFAGVALLLNPRENTVKTDFGDSLPPVKVVPFVFYFGAAFGFSPCVRRC